MLNQANEKTEKRPDFCLTDFVRAHSITGWSSLLLWSFTTAVFAFSAVSLASIGMLIAPFALIILLIVAFLGRSWPEAPLGGFLIGPGAICLLVAFLQMDSLNCPAGLPRSSIGQGMQCGGLDSTPWLIGGLIMVAFGIAIFYLLGAALKEYRSASCGMSRFPSNRRDHQHHRYRQVNQRRPSRSNESK